MLEVRSLPMVSLETRMYPTSMSEKLLFACFRLSKQPDMFFELILPGCDRGVKASWHSVGKPLIGDRAPQLRRKRSRGKLIENQWVNFLGFAHRLC